jgi:hypothetical protein
MTTKTTVTKTTVMNIDTIDRQKKYVDKLRKTGHGLGIVFADAFLRGMRDLGYKDPAWAIAEQLDNAFQAAADTVAIRFGYDKTNKSQAKPDQIAICDNGNGMIPEMISYAVRWGGTDREGDRFGFGRYGYGLPSSAVSIASRYTVYSKTSETVWYGVTVDIRELGAAAGDVEKTEQLLVAKPMDPPAWLVKGTKGADKLDIGGIKSGTVVVLEELDRLKTIGGWIKADTLRSKLLKQFGVIYRYWLPERTLLVDGERTEPVDPLFLMEHARFYDETAVRAERVETRTFEVETVRGTTGTVTVRASVLPPNFQLVDPTTYRYGDDNPRAKPNSRHKIMREYNGLQIMRERRQIDTIQPRWTKYQTYDANIKIEIDFEPELDEFFGITTSKQQIVIADEMWDRLQSNGKNNGALVDLVRDMRARFKALQAELDAKYRNEETKDENAIRPSVAAMQDTEKFKGSVTEPSSAQKEEADKNLQEAATVVAQVTGEQKADVVERLKEKTSQQRFEITFVSNPEGPFYRPERLGEQKRVIINSDHPFYTKVYAAAPEVSAALEVLLFVFAERELEVKNEAEMFYKAERQRWSERLRHALDNLTSDESMVNKAAAVAEKMHVEAALAPQES